MQRPYVLNSNQTSSSNTPHSSQQKTFANDQTKTQQQRSINQPIRLTASLVSQGQSTIREPIKLQLMMHNQKDKGSVRQPIKISQLSQELKTGATQAGKVQNSSQKIEVNSNDQNKPQSVSSSYNLYQKNNLYQSAASNIQQQIKKPETVQKTQTTGSQIPRVVRTESGKNQTLGQQIKNNIIPNTSYQQQQQQLQQKYQQQTQNKQNAVAEQKSSFNTLFKNKPQTPQSQTPQAQTPQVHTFQAQTPQAQTPQVQTPQVHTFQAQTRIQTPNKAQDYPSSLYSASKTNSQQKYVAGTQVINKQPTESQHNSNRASPSTDQKYQGYNQYQQYQQQMLQKLKQQQNQQPKKQQSQSIQYQQQQQLSEQKSNRNYSPGVVKQVHQQPSPKTKQQLGRSLSLNESQPLESARSNFYNQDQSNIFSQFKVKYDELRMNYDKLRQEYDDMNREKKKMQIKLLNSNPQYYEKEIKRLRTEVQKYQQQNEDHKYKYLQAENVKKQLEATNKVKQEELKTIIKQLQKEKINNVELKHQNDQRQRVFNRIRMEFEKSNEGTLKNYDDAISKVNKLDGALKTKSAEYDQLKNNFERLERRHNQNKDEFKKYKEINEERVKNLSKNLETKTTDSHRARAQATNRISELEQEIQKLKSQRASIELLKTRKTQQVSVIKSNRQLQLDIVRLQDRIRNLEYDLLQKDSVIIELQKTIDKIKLNEEVQECEQKIRVLQEEKSEILRQNQKVKGQMIREIDRLRLQLMQAPEQVYHSSNTNFQDILKIQLDQNAKLKRELSIKIDEIYNLKSDADEIKVDKQNLLSEIEVLKKIKKSEQKNVKIESEIAAQHIKNDIDSYKRKIQLLQQKLVLKNKEVKQKDNFIMSSVLGRSKPEDTPFIMADFQRIFQTNYVEKLAQANKRIENLNNPQQTPLTARSTQGTPYKK